MGYAAQDIRNICLLGHGGNGKTSLAESMLFLTGSADRLGKVPDGNTVCDFDPEEIKRQVTISTAIAPVVYRNCKINVLDTPGYFDFVGQAMEAIRVADAAVIVSAAKGGLSVGAEKAWKYCEKNRLPRIIYISRTDEENSDYASAYEALRDRFGTCVAPVISPIWDENKRVTALIDVLNRKCFEIKGGKRVDVPVPENKQEVADELYNQLKEAVAETSEEFMEKFFSGEDFTREEMIQGLRTGVRERTLVPVVCGSALSGLGTTLLLDTIVDLVPNPLESRLERGVDDQGAEIEFALSPSSPTCAFVFKTSSDQYGKYSYVKVVSGTLTSDTQLVNTRTGMTEKIGRLFFMKGKKAEETKEIGCGDIGAIAKMEKVRTGDTLCDPRKVITLSPINFPEPCYSVAISPKTRGQEDKIAAGLGRMSEEDLTFTLVNNAETRQMVVSGTGDMQMDVLVARLKSRFGVDAELDEPRVPYREKIRKKVKAQGRHKKQSGGHGQFGDVWIEFEPSDNEEMEFAENVFGGSVPRNFFPAVEKGLREAVLRGPLAGYPVVNLKCTLVDGSSHPVDSSEMAFKTAAHLAYKAGLPTASPVLLEPIGELKVTIPDSYMGDVIGDLNKRRGRVMGMNPNGEGEQVIDAEVPMSEMTTYAIDLRSITQSRGAFTFKFTRYEDAPPTEQAKAIEAAKALRADDE